MNHQELLEKYFSSERGVISEYSTDFENDTLELIDECERYAMSNGLDIAFMNDAKEQYGWTRDRR